MCVVTQSNAVQRAGDFRAQAIKGIEIVAGGISLEAWHVENDHRLLEGWGEEWHFSSLPGLHVSPA